MNAPGDHVCPICESACDDVTTLRMAVRALQRLVTQLLFANARERELWQFAFAELEARYIDREEASDA